MSLPVNGLEARNLISTAVSSTVITSAKHMVLSRGYKQVSITGILSNHPINHGFNGPNVWAVIRPGANNTTYQFSNSTYAAPIIYQTPVISNFAVNKVPYTFPVPGKIVLDFAALANLTCYKGIGYGLELYAQDATGTYLLSSSYAVYYLSQSGGISWPVADRSRDIFIARY